MSQSVDIERAGDAVLQESIPLHMTAIIGNCPGDGGCAEIEARLRQLIGELSHDLAMPLDLQLQLRPAAPDELAQHQHHRLEIDGTPCRVERRNLLPTDDTSHSAANAVMETLYRNRSLLVTQGLVDAVHRLLDPGQEGDGSASDIRRTLHQAMERCLDIPSAIRLCRTVLDSAEDSEYEMELESAILFAKEVSVELGRSLYDAAFAPSSNPQGSEKYLIDTMAEMLRDGLFYELGIRLPGFAFSFGETLRDGEFRIRINRLRCPPQSGLNADEALVNDSADRLSLLNIGDAREAINPANGSAAAIIPSEYQDICEQAGLTTWDAVGYAILSVSASMRRHASALFTLAHTEHNLDLLNQAFPMLIFNVMERYHILTLTHVLRVLLAEEISIRDLRSILEAMLELNGTHDEELGRYIVFSVSEAHLAPSSRRVDQLTAGEIADYVRSALKRYISHKYTRGNNTLIVHLMDPAVESRLREPTRLDSQERELLLEAVESEIGSLPPASQNPVILTTTCVRSKLRQAVALEYPRLAVLSYLELNPDMNIQPIARIGWPAS